MTFLRSRMLRLHLAVMEKALEKPLVVKEEPGVSYKGLETSSNRSITSTMKQDIQTIIEKSGLFRFTFGEYIQEIKKEENGKIKIEEIHLLTLKGRTSHRNYYCDKQDFFRELLGNNEISIVSSSTPETIALFARLLYIQLFTVSS